MKKRNQQHIITSKARPKAKRVGMYELSYFVNLVKSFYTRGNTDHNIRFWQLIHLNCPHLARAIDAKLLGEWGAITSPVISLHRIPEAPTRKATSMKVR